MLIHLEQQNAKPLVKWNDLLLGQWKGPDPLLTGSWGGACIFSTGCRFANLDPEQADSSCRSPPGTWFLHCHEHKEQEENSSVKAATENSHAPGAEAGFLVLHYLLEFVQLMSIESVMPSNHLILCHSFFCLPSIFLSIRVFSNKLDLCIRKPKYWSLSFSISPSSEYSGLMYFRKPILGCSVPKPKQ